MTCLAVRVHVCVCLGGSSAFRLIALIQIPKVGRNKGKTAVEGGSGVLT